MTEQEIEAMKRNIDKQLDEYEADIEAAVKWHREWKARQPQGFRSARRVSHETEA